MSLSWKLYFFYYFIALSFALQDVSTWTPCSLGAWINHLQNCTQSCYGESFYNKFYNSTACGDYDSMLNATAKSDLNCLCTNELAGVSDQKNVTKCETAACGESDSEPVFNDTYWSEMSSAYERMCLYAAGDTTVSLCNSSSTSSSSLAASFASQPLDFLVGFGIAVGALIY